MKLLEFLIDNHHVFSLDEGKSTLISMEINTRDAYPQKQRVRRMPPAVRQEVAGQIEKMTRDEVIEPQIPPGPVQSYSFGSGMEVFA